MELYSGLCLRKGDREVFIQQIDGDKIIFSAYEIDEDGEPNPIPVHSGWMPREKFIENAELHLATGAVMYSVIMPF